MMALHYLADMKHGSCNSKATISRELLKIPEQIEPMNEYEETMEEQYEDISHYMSMK